MFIADLLEERHRRLGRHQVRHAVKPELGVLARFATLPVELHRLHEFAGNLGSIL
jgi:hypothetical protein